MTTTTTSTTTTPARASRSRLPRRLPAVLAFAAFLLAWTAYAAVAPGGGRLLPTPLAVIEQLVVDGAMIMGALSVTLVSALQGLLYGTLVAFAGCVIVVSVPFLRRATTRQLTIVYCIPLAAIAPLLFLLLPLPGPHIALAAIAVVFPVYISLVQGLTAPHAQWEDLANVVGGGRIAYFFRVQVPASTPNLLVAARIAGPTAVLGTTLAEYFGGTRGVGVLMINSMAQVNAPRAYALGLVITLLSVVVYLLVDAVERLLPWTAELGS